MSTWQGERLRLTVFGQSHSKAIGMVLEGLPAGTLVDEEKLAAFLQRRAPGRNRLSTQRKEADTVEWVSGIVDGVTCGAPLTGLIYNTDARSQDYKKIADLPRPSHADWPAHVKFAGHQDVRGGGAFSGRLTAPLCIAGGIAKAMLEVRGIRVAAHVLSVADINDRAFDAMGEKDDVIAATLTRTIPVKDESIESCMAARIEAARLEADSVGGVIECQVTGLPVGLGGELFNGIDGACAQALFGIPGVKGVEFGEGFRAATLMGSENNDAYGVKDGAIQPLTNHAGGVLGGMTTGLPLNVRVAMKPTPSIGKVQQTVSLTTNEPTEYRVPGRHDPCIVVRAVPVVEAVLALVLLDALLIEGAPGATH